ncbi:fibronectin type III domain-containing protein [Pseudomonas sp. REP124]|uniref:fibronectin type III domain-containing protein n=1 Tax=Pseudomonas sp. REP124 TaxID=2875731 RepID=UPI001CCA1711|nr:fibronectin type III domain-containing protein [Pseudomonas sp. REP124]MBZ9785383.1 fibronectin type III domain-containing protein [Pseudomonas sp. REP124]
MSRIEPSAVENPVEPRSGIRICAPGNIRGWRTSSTTALLSWDEPYSWCNQCPNAIGYEVTGEGLPTLNVLRPPCEIKALKPDVEYQFQVTAKASVTNVSDPSPYRLLKLHPPGKPGLPQLLDVSFSSLSLSWERANPGFTGIRYRVYLNGFLVKQVDEPQVCLTHLRSFTVYKVEVRAVNDAGVSGPSGATFKTRVRTPSNLRFSQRNGLCRVAWDPVFKQPAAHEVTVNGQVFTTAAGRLGHSFWLSDVSPGPVPHHLKFKVQAMLDGEVSDIALFESTVSDDVPPSRPGAPVVSDITDTSATLSWEPSSDDVGVASYEAVLYGFLPYRTLNTQFTFTGLASGSYHWAFVRARDKQGNASGASPAVAFKTTGQAPSPPPSAPELSITALTATSARLEWWQPDEGTTTGAKILINEEHYLDVLIFTSVVLNDLVPGVEYRISVTVFDMYGQLSEPTLLIYEPQDITAPSTPGNLHSTQITTDSVTLAWNESTDDIGVLEYVIYNSHAYFDSTPLLHYTAVDLLPGSYSFEVCAMDLAGNASEPAALTIEIEGPTFNQTTPPQY